jgi:transcriptional regulator with XRE-family HTH domain
MTAGVSTKLAYIPELGDAVRQAVHQSGLTYRDIAEEAGKRGMKVSSSSVGELVRGRKMSPDILLAVAVVVQADLEDWLRLAQYPIPDATPKRVARGAKELLQARRAETTDAFRAEGLMIREVRVTEPAADHLPALTSPAERLSAGILALKRKYNYPGPLTLRGYSGRQNLTDEEVDQALAGLEEDMLAELAEARGREAREGAD